MWIIYEKPDHLGSNGTFLAQLNLKTSFFILAFSNLFLQFILLSNVVV